MMKRSHIAIAIIMPLSLAACDGGVGSDGYRFDKEEWSKTEYITRNVLYPSVVELRRNAPPETQRDGHKLAAWSRISFNADGTMVCEKHIVDPAVVHAPEWIGHEDIHCIKGRWHP